MPNDESIDSSAQVGWTSVHEIISDVKETIPWLGDPMEKALNRELSDREFGRICDVLEVLVPSLRAFSSELSELYVKTPDFHRLLEQTLKCAADERQDAKRKVYRVFLSDAITSPCDPFEKQLRFLSTFQELRLDQMKLLVTLATRPDTTVHGATSPIHMLHLRLPDIPRDRIEGLLDQMDELGIIRVADLKSGGVAAWNPGTGITPLGKQLIRYLLPRS